MEGIFFNQMILSARMQSGLHVVLMLLPFAPSLFDGYAGRRGTQLNNAQLNQSDENNSEKKLFPAFVSEASF
jgi:hypothetical protein